MVKMLLKSNKCILAAVLVIIAISTSILLSFQYIQYTRPFKVEDGLIKLGNRHYEIAFNDKNGRVEYIFDKSTKEKVALSTKDSSLWMLQYNDETRIASNSSTSCSYRWDSAGKKLIFSYTGSPQINISIEVTDSKWLRMKAEVANDKTEAVKSFEFPTGICLSEETVKDALLPMMPGAKLKDSFFKEHKSFDSIYPGVMFSDYLSIRTAKGKIALYSQKGEYVQPVNIGFKHRSNDGSYTEIVHNYRTWIEKGTKWISPYVYIHVGQDYKDTIYGYRINNGIDKFKSLKEKLGSKKQKYFESPLYKLDISDIGKTFEALKSDVIDKMNTTGIIHPVAFQTGGHDKNYPDFVPADDFYGDNAAFAGFVNYTKAKGNLVMPYTNFSWWCTDSPTLSSMPLGFDMRDIASVKDDGSAIMEFYGPNSGYVMNQYDSLVKSRINTEHEKLIKDIGMDGIFEDQWGARSAPYDFNTKASRGGNPSVIYFEGVLAHTKAHSASNLMTECGVDMLAENEIGFMGTNYLWDLCGYRNETAPYTEYYPMIGMLCRDKVMLYQHDLALETLTDNIGMFRWNLAQGYNLNAAFYNGSLKMDNPWLNLVGLFQKYILSKYVDQLVKNYEEIADGVTLTTFDSYKVYSNSNKDKPYKLDNCSIAPGGAAAISYNGSATGGVFTSYNGKQLSDGEHYLIEVRKLSSIKVFQPIGEDTGIRIKKPDDWINIKITAYRHNGLTIDYISPKISNGYIEFNYAQNFNSQVVGYYDITGK